MRNFQHAVVFVTAVISVYFEDGVFHNEVFLSNAFGDDERSTSWGQDELSEGDLELFLVDDATNFHKARIDEDATVKDAIYLVTGHIHLEGYLNDDGEFDAEAYPAEDDPLLVQYVMELT